MKTNIGVFFGGRSTEHEISVISASQAMHAINREKYDVTPIYISKQGKFYTGDISLRNVRAVRVCRGSSLHQRGHLPCRIFLAWIYI